MKVLFLTLLDYVTMEEKSIYTDLMREFINGGHTVTVVSPTERRHGRQTELLQDGPTTILKLRIGNMQKTNLIEKGISTLLLEPQLEAGIRKYLGDVVFDLVLYSTPPITLYKAVEFMKQRDGAKSYLLLKDIFPQNAVDLGMLTKSSPGRILYQYFRRKEKRLYKISDYIGCMSDANVRFLLQHNPDIDNTNVEVCPNSMEPRAVVSGEQDKRAIRNKYDIPQNKTVFLYGGNLGKPQGIDFLMECLRSNEQRDNAFFLIVGSGTELLRLQTFFDTEQLRNAKLIEHLPHEEFDLLADACDIGLIFLDRRFTIPNFPSRILSYMQASMPVLAATDSNTDIGEVIERGEFGFWCESDDLEAFDAYADRLCDEALCAKLGKNANGYFMDHYTAKHSYEIIMKHFTH